MKKLVLILLCAFASFAFTDISSLEENGIVSPCDGYGGQTHITIWADCTGDGNEESYFTYTACRNKIPALQQQVSCFCENDSACDVDEVVIGG